MSQAQTHAAKVIDQFTRWAKPFAVLPAHSEADGLARMLAAAAIRPDSRVLDVACGPGIVACAAAALAQHVTGIDLTPAMIDQARERQRGLGLLNVEWHVGDAAALPFADRSFDRVLTRYSFHHMECPAAAFAEMTRVCRPSGRIVVVDCTPSPASQTPYDAMEKVRDPSHASALTLDQLCTLGRDAGLTEVARDDYRLEALVASLADNGDMPKLNAIFDADIASGEDRLDVQAERGPDGLRMRFPVSIVAWETKAV